MSSFCVGPFFRFSIVSYYNHKLRGGVCLVLVVGVGIMY